MQYSLLPSVLCLTVLALIKVEYPVETLALDSSAVRSRAKEKARDS